MPKLDVMIKGSLTGNPRYCVVVGKTRYSLSVRDTDDVMADIEEFKRRVRKAVKKSAEV